MPPRHPGPSRSPVALALPALLLLTGLAPGAAAQETPLTGFTPERSGEQETCEARFLDLPSSEAFSRHHERLTRRPHVAGTPANDRVGDYIATSMEEAGLQVETYPYDVYIPDPSSAESNLVALVTPIRTPLNNREYVLEEDRFSDDAALGPGWNAFSGSGDVTAPVVYANYGRKEDFETLEELGVEVEGRIVVARYGGNFRGYKAKYAEEAGAAGLVIYSDPADGGYVDGLPYPEGRQLSESTVQRGSLLARWGDPLTPGRPALPRETSDVEREDPDDLDFLHTIPVAPLPHGSAREILERMSGEGVPDGWQGGLPFAYRLQGGSELTVRVKVEQPLDLERVRNVVGTLEGTEHPDEWIVLGSHYDAWTFGAVDPNSGTAMLLTLAEALGALAEDGCRPERSIRIAHWDVEEFGIIGSIEWVEQLRERLMEGAVAYLNADGAVSGASFGASASPSLKGPIVEATRRVDHPDGGTVHAAWTGEASDGSGPPMGNLGGGSDHVGFYMHAGVPSAGLSMSGSSPMYHSGYDDRAWYERFADTAFVYGPTLARVDGLLALRLARADLVPYDVQRYPEDLETHLEALASRAAEVDYGLELSPVQEAVGDLAEAAEAFVAARDRRLAAGDLPDDVAREVNRGLIGLEKAFLHPDGLQWRGWYRSLYASSDPFSGYASWMLPALRYEVETDGSEAEPWVDRYVAAVHDLTRRLGELTALLRGR